MLYTVIRIGIYDQGIFGIYSNHQKAVYAIKRAVKKESDDYHGFVIRQYELNKDGYMDNDEVIIKGSY